MHVHVAVYVFLHFLFLVGGGDGFSIKVKWEWSRVDKREYWTTCILLYKWCSPQTMSSVCTAKTILWNSKYSSRITRHAWTVPSYPYWHSRNPTSVSKETVVASLLQIVSHFLNVDYIQCSIRTSLCHSWLTLCNIEATTISLLSEVGFRKCQYG